MIKKYYSKTSLSINVPLKNGQNAHVSFDSLTGGGSVFYTGDEEMQEALESHHKFGRLFKLEAAIEPAKPKSKAKAVKKSAPAPAEPEVETAEEVEDTEGAEGAEATEVETETEEAETEETETEESEEVTEEDEETDEDEDLQEIHVTDIEDAKNYLANTFGVSRTKIRYKKQIVEMAKAKGVKFVGL